MARLWHVFTVYSLAAYTVPIIISIPTFVRGEGNRSIRGTGYEAIYSKLGLPNRPPLLLAPLDLGGSSELDAQRNSEVMNVITYLHKEQSTLFTT